MDSLILNSHKLFFILLITLFSGLLYLLAPILTPFVIGALLAYLVNPLVTQLMRLRLPRLLSIIIIFSLLFSLIILFVLLLVPLIQKQISNLIDMLPKIIAWGEDTVIPWISDQLGIHEPSMGSIKTTLVTNLAKTSNTAEKFFNTVMHSSFILVEWIINLILIPVVTFYLLLDWNKVMANIGYLLPRRIEPTVVKLMKECDTVLSAFFRGQLLVVLVLSLFYAVGLTWIGLRVGLILGFMVGLVSIVPYLGVIIGIIIASIAAYIQLNTLSSVLFILLLFIAGHIFEHLYLTPKFVGNRIGLHPVAVIFAILAGGQLFGFFGILLALPVAAVIMVWLRYLIEKYHQSSLYQ